MKLKLYITTFTAGATLMSLEILAGRTLNPQYGATIYVWGSIIGIFLLSLGLGYYIGGKVADRYNTGKMLSYILIITSFLILIIPFIYQGVINILNFLPNTYAPLIALSIIYFLPSLLHGFVSPYVLKLSAAELHGIGDLSGKLYSLATIGSVAGTFLTTFVLILFIPVNSIYFILSIILTVVSFIFLPRKDIIFTALICIIIAICSWCIYYDYSNTFNNNQEIHSNESPYGLVAVSESNGIRSLMIDGGNMIEVNIENEEDLLNSWRYIGCMDYPFLLKSDIKDILTLGIGGGLFQKLTSQNHDVKIDAVDINEDVVDAAKEYFGLPESESLHTYIEDARVFLKKTDKKYDYISIDIFHYSPEGGYRIPSHLVTQEFYQLAQKHLNPGGIFAMNFFGSNNGQLFRSGYNTISSVFDNVYAYDCYTQVIFASDYDFGFYNLSQAESEWGTYYQPDFEGSEIIFTDNYTPINYFHELIKQD